MKTLFYKKKVEMVSGIGPEDPLVLEFMIFQNDAEINHIPVIGPSKVGAN